MKTKWDKTADKPIHSEINEYKNEKTLVNYLNYGIYSSIYNPIMELSYKQY